MKKYKVTFKAWSKDKGWHVCYKIVSAVSMTDAVKKADLHPPIIIGIETM